MFTWLWLLLILLLAQAINIAPSGSWHDSQRLLQIALACVAAIQLVRMDALERHLVGWVLGLLAVGLCSAALSQHPGWAVLEVALWGGCAAVFIRCTQVPAQPASVPWWPALAWALCLCSLTVVLRFVLAYITSLLLESSLDTHLLIGGFANPRFLGQFATLALPLLGGLLCRPLRTALPRSLLILAALCFIGLWTAAIATGTRGTWMALGCTALCLLGLSRSGRAWAMVQAVGASCGLLLSYGMFSLLPDLLGIEVINHAAQRLHLGLSAREIIWQQAMDMALAHPWLGAGPMGFATLRSVAGAHPHQMLLQWAAEWGLPAMLAIVAGLLYAAWAVARQLYANRSVLDPHQLRYTALMAAVMAALLQSMVDGVFVMPYTQMWLAVLAGLAYGVHRQCRRTPLPLAPQWALRCTRIACLLCGMVLVAGIVPSFKDAYTHAKFDDTGTVKPRFWVQGFISAPPVTP